MTAKRIGVLGTSGRIRDASRFSISERFQILGQNSGNLMFQFAVAGLLANEMVHLELSETAFDDFEALNGASYLVFPAANHLRLADAEWDGLCNYLEAVNLPLIILGLGAQSAAVGGDRRTVDDLKAHKSVSRLAAIIRERAAYVSVRGEYSQMVCEELGIRDTEILGCPSALINRNDRLGARLELVIDGLKSKQREFCFGLTAAAPWEITSNPTLLDLERKMLGWLGSNEGLYIQQSGGHNAYLAAVGRLDEIPQSAWRSLHETLAPETPDERFQELMKKRGRFYLSADSWIQESSTLDFTIGTRLHGNMASLAGGTPGLVVVHDSRTNELVRTMCLPTVLMEDVLSASNLSEVIAKVDFSGEKFDAWRGTVSSRFRSAMIELGLTPTI